MGQGNEPLKNILEVWGAGEWVYVIKEKEDQAVRLVRLEQKVYIRNGR